MEAHGPPLRQEYVDGLGWCNVYKDIYSSQPEYTFTRVPLTAAEAAALVMETNQDEGFVDEVLRDGTEQDLVRARGQRVTAMA